MQRARLSPAFWWPLVFGLFVVGVPALARPEDDAKADKPQAKPVVKAEKPSAKTKGARELDWMTLDQGLLRVRDKYLPAALLFNPPPAVPLKEPENEDARSGRAPGAPGEAPSRTPNSAEETLADGMVRDALKHFVLIRV